MNTQAILAICVVLLAAAGTVSAVTPNDISYFYKGYFAEFQKDMNNRMGCYYMTQDVYNDVAIMMDHLSNFTMRDLPIVVASGINSVQLFLDHDDACKTRQTFNETLVVLKDPKLLLTRLDFLSLITIVNNIQQGMMNNDFMTLGRGIGLLVKKALNFQI